MGRYSAISFFAAGLACAMPSMASTQWTRLSSPNFDLYTTGGEKQGREAIAHFEQVKGFFRQASPLGDTHPSRLRIVQFVDDAEYARFRPHDFIPAFFLSSGEREFIVMSGSALKDPRPSIHEYMHVVIRHSGLKLPLWLNEGWAEVFSTLRQSGKETAVGDLLPERMNTLNKEKWLDFDALASVDSKSPVYNEGARAGIYYAESWALTHMLFLSPDYKDNFGKFIMALHNGKSAQEACQSAFGKSSAQVFSDLRTYFERKRLFGTLFSTRTGQQEPMVTATVLPEFDARMMLADLTAAAGKKDEANAEYSRLEQEQPDRMDLLQAIGEFAAANGRDGEARGYFQKVYDAGGTDPQMCYRLAKLDIASNVEPGHIVPVLERALKAKPDFAEAKLQLGLLKVRMREFSDGLQLLTSADTVKADTAGDVYCSLALAQIEVGDVPDSRQTIQDCRKWSKTPAEIARVERIAKFIEARANPAVAVHLNEKQVRVTGMLRGVQCSPEGNRIVVAIGQKVAIFDLPAEDAIEMPIKPVQNFKFLCGDMSPVQIGIEAAAPRSSIETSAGIVRRLVF